MPRTEPKNIIITGGARGIGRATARHLLSLPAQHRVFLLDADADELEYCVNVHLKEYSHPDDTRIPIPHLPIRLSSAVVNLRDASAIDDAVERAAQFFGGRIDVLVNNAGIARAMFSNNMTMADRATRDEWTAYVETNLSAPFLLSQAVIPHMRVKPESKYPDTAGGEGKSGDGVEGTKGLNEGGCIIHVSSFRAHISDPNCEGYAATKNGLCGLTHAMAVSLQPFGIRVNAVLPGWVSVSHENKQGDEDAAKAKRGEGAGTRQWESLGKEDHELHPAGRVGRGEDIAETVEWIMGAGFVSGAEIVVDGGAGVKKNPDV